MPIWNGPSRSSLNSLISLLDAQHAQHRNLQPGRALLHVPRQNGDEVQYVHLVLAEARVRLLAEHVARPELQLQLDREDHGEGELAEQQLRLVVALDP